MSRSLYLVKPEWQELGDDGIVEEFHGTREELDLAVELARLAGMSENADAIRRVVESAYDHDAPHLDGPAIAEILRLTDGLEGVLIRDVVDERWMVPTERLAELRSKFEHINLAESRGDLARHAVGEAMMGLVALRNILGKAQERGLYVAF